MLLDHVSVHLPVALGGEAILSALGVHHRPIMVGQARLESELCAAKVTYVGQASSGRGKDWTEAGVALYIVV